MKKKKKASNNTKKKEKRELLFSKAKKLKISNYQKLSNDKLEQEILKLENSNRNKEEDISLLSKNELVEIAKKLKVKNYSKLRKNQLIEEINKLKENQLKQENLSDKNLKEDNPSGKEINNSKEEIKEKKLNVEIPDNLEKLNKSNLIELCKFYKIKNYSKMTKSKIIKVLTNIKNNKSENIVNDKELNKQTIDKKSTLNNLEENKKINKEKKAYKKDLKSKELKIENEVKENAKYFQDDVKTKILFMPSKYGFGKTNEEFILEDEKDLNLKTSIVDVKDEITLMPIDPYKAYIYWTLSENTLKKLNKLKIKELILKLNDVTGIIYNGRNANSFWFEKCLLNSPNWYINMPRNNFNLCIELGYLIGKTFVILATSNVVHIPTSTPSPIVKDEFVIVDFNIEKENKINNTKKKNFYTINESKNVLKPIVNEKNTKLGKIKRIPKYFVKEYEIKNEIKKEKPKIRTQELIKETLPPKLPKIYFEIPNKEYIYSKPSKVKTENNKRINFEYKKNKTLDSSNKSIEKNYVIDRKSKGKTKVTKNYEDEKFYYKIPQKDKVIKFYYSNNINTPYQRIFYYFIEPLKKIHQKIYKISLGPYWIKEFIGGSEKIKFIGASERFIGASEIFFGASEKFIGASNIFVGASERFIGASEVFLEASEKYYLKRIKKYNFSEPVKLNIDKFIFQDI
ncbi:MAG: hypothetical protein KatS3mg068_2617 [Candidatus Sericytochromatia bacterium]|nr:MAG: hypothetical protein KatS3mg068_2617 [Candidatus Sericytochromatia bacterium]